MEDEKIIKNVANEYHKLLRQHNFFPNYNQELQFYDVVKEACSKHLAWEQFILAVETAYFALANHLRKIIKYDFFYQNYSFWWEEFYTRKQYRAFKKEAVDIFFQNLIKTCVLNVRGEIQYAKFN